MPESEALYNRLRILAVEDPKQARAVFLAAFEAKSDELNGFLTRLKRPNEGRLRQVVANAVRNHPEKARVLADLLEWQETERDEFTRRAINGALLDLDPQLLRMDHPVRQIAVSGEIAEVYRYVSDRLRHRLRNIMMSAQAQATRLNLLIESDARSDIQATVGKFNDAMTSLARELEAISVDPDHFKLRSIGLADWLRQMNGRYSAKYGPVGFEVQQGDQSEVRIYASDYLLETIFWNIWINAHQSVGEGCRIMVDFAVEGKQVNVVIADNGTGFPRELKDIAFQQVYSTKDPNRGRGLLEIQDAVERLVGHVELHEVTPSEYRLRIRLPLETA